MTILDSIILGIVQGLTEFLPVSSSGHLVLFQRFLGLEEPGVTLEVLLHFGTLLSVFWVFRKDFIDLLSFHRSLYQRRFLLLLIIGVIPTGIIGILFKSRVESAFQSTMIVGIMLLVTGGLVWLINSISSGEKDIKKMRYTDALWIGVMQGLAVIPGISRSGSTIAGALWRGLERETAVRYSFMLSSPVILGATLLEAGEMYKTGIESMMLWNYAVGGLFAFLFGIFAIRFFINLLAKKRFHYFSYYCWIIGIVTIILSLVYR